MACRRDSLASQDTGSTVTNFTTNLFISIPPTASSFGAHDETQQVQNVCMRIELLYLHYYNTQYDHEDDYERTCKSNYTIRTVKGETAQHAISTNMIWWCCQCPPTYLYAASPSEHIKQCQKT